MSEDAPPKDMRARLSAWRARLDLAKKKAPLRKERFETTAEIPLEDLYTATDAPVDEARELGLPGEYPFTRGVQPTMYRGRLWTMRQYAGFGDAAESNRRYHYLLKQGQSGLSVAFDLPTLMGRDPDHPLARGEVGRVGVSIASLDDMRLLLDGLPLGEISTSMTINATASTLLALYVAIADERGIPRAKLSGTIQNDILKEYIARGTYIYPPRPSMRLVVDTFAWCKVEVPRWNTISISGYHIREAGSDAVQEVAFTLADGIAYVEAAVKAGLDVDEFAGRLSFFFNAHNVLVEEVAKYRAARRLWARIMRERFSAKDPKSWHLRFHAQTAGSSLQAQQPQVNVVRTTVQALSRSTPTRSTKRWRCRRRIRRGWHCAPSRCSPTSRAPAIWSIRSAAPMRSRRSPARSSGRPRSTSRASTSSAEWSRRSSSRIRSGRSRSGPTSISARSRRSSRSSSG